MDKCNFLKKHIQYLGHNITGSGIKPVLEKIESIKSMPAPTNPTEVKQFLGLVGYYCKFIPHFTDIARPLNFLTRKGIEFEWTTICQENFDLLKNALATEPILVYPDPNKLYVLFTDASKYAWSCVLTQEHTHVIKDQEVKVLHPITYQSRLFKGSQVNWATLTKEAHAIYMAVCKLDYYLVDADITLCSDHLPLKRFLQKNTLNSKVNNWAIEISPFKIKFEYIKGIKNTLADTMSHLVAIDPSIQNENEPYGCEFSYYAFDTLPPIEIEVIMVGNQLPSITLTDVEGHTKTLFHTDHITTIEKALEEHLTGEKLEELSELQGNDPFCKNIISKLNFGRLQTHNPYFIEHDVLKRTVQYNGQAFHLIVLPMCLTQHILRLAHNQLGHNGLNHTYNAL